MKLARTIYNYAGVIAASALLPLSAASVHAADNLTLPTPGGGTNFQNAASLTDSIKRLVPNVINVVLLISGILAVFYLMFSGLQYITSAGNADKIKVARAGIINAIIGIVIILSAYFIIRFAVGIGQTVSQSDRSTF